MSHFTYDECRDLVSLVLKTGQYVAGRSVLPGVFERPEFRQRFPDRTSESLYAKFNKDLAVKEMKIGELRKSYRINERNELMPSEQREFTIQ